MEFTKEQLITHIMRHSDEISRLIKQQSHHDNEYRKKLLAVNEIALAAKLQEGNSPVIPDWHIEAERIAKLHGASFVIFRHGEKPVCADPSKFWFGYDPAAPQQEQIHG